MADKTPPAEAKPNLQIPRVLTGAEAAKAVERAGVTAPRVPGAPVTMSADVASQLAALEAARAEILKGAGFDPNGPIPKTEKEAALDAIRKSPTLAERHPDRFARRALLHPSADPIAPGKFDDALDPNARR